jgi:hypothetical protein
MAWVDVNNHAPNDMADTRIDAAQPTPFIEALRAHRAAQLEERLQAGNEWQNDQGLVFTQPNGWPIDPRADNRGLEVVAPRSRLP